MVNLYKYFDKIYCINLDRRPDRYEFAKKEFEKFGIENVERFSAIDGNLITNNTNLLKGELGILETHISLIKKCIEEGLNNVLIMEDDVVFTNKLNNLDEYMLSVPSDWDFIYFGGNHKYGNPPEKINEKVIKLNFTVAIHCIAIKNTMFETILNVLEMKKKQVDGYYGDLQKIFNAYSFYPNIANQRIGYSDIQNKPVDYTDFFNY